jgi:hypothetical protein
MGSYESVLHWLAVMSWTGGENAARFVEQSGNRASTGSKGDRES